MYFLSEELTISFFSIMVFHISSCKIFTVSKIIVIAKIADAQTQFCYFDSSAYFLSFFHLSAIFDYTKFFHFFFLLGFAILAQRAQR